MKFSPLILATLSLAAGSFIPDVVDGTSTLEQLRDQEGLIHLPLKRLHHLDRKDVHPQIVSSWFTHSYIEVRLNQVLDSCISSMSIGEF
jgi:hypothetical protein